MENDFFEAMAIESGELSSDDIQILEDTYFVGEEAECNYSV